MARARIVGRRCAISGCRNVFHQASTEPFVTCPACRNPLPENVGGCTRYSGVKSNVGESAVFRHSNYANRIVGKI